jgi:predicted MFS family arabinose efflux permease
MSHISTIKKLLSSPQNPTALYTGTFFFSGGHGGIFTLALPFVVTLLGGSDKDLGLCFGLGTMAYMISCLTVANHLDRFSPKRTLQFSSAFISIAFAILFLYTRIFQNQNLPLSPITTIIIIEILTCLALALFWPPMMGWLSTGHQGHALSKRMGTFNITWSLALVITPVIAGFIIQFDPTIAVLVAAIFLAIAFVAVSTAPAPNKLNTTDNTANTHTTTEIIHPLNDAFCSMARLGLITGCIAIALLRTQFALLFTENMGFSKSQFGILTTLFCLANFICFYWTGRTKNWHYKFSPFIASQLLTAAAMIIIIFTRSLISMYIAATFIGIGQSFIYSSHQFYCLAGKANRSGSMAIHELLISIGYGTGAIAGGYLAEYLNRYWPYWFGFIAIITALAIQAWIFAAHKKS